MKHPVWIVLLFVSFSLCAENVIADKLDRIGRFSYEDSFDENLVETVLKNSSSSVKRNVKRLLYPDGGYEEMQRLLLLGGTSNASTTVIAKAIAVRCGYEYYVIEASALLQAYREGRQMLLNEVRSIIKQGKPIAIIITELPEMADYSGLLASTLWLLIDQCAQYQDVFVIATSTFKKGQLSQEIKDRFNGDIISVALDKSIQDRIEGETVKKVSWLERNKTACLIVGGLACFALGVAHLYAQMLFADAQAERDSKQVLLENKKIALYEQALLVQKEERDIQNQILLCEKKVREIQDKQYAKQIEQYDMQGRQYTKQGEQYDKQIDQYKKQVEQYAMQKEQYSMQLRQYIVQKYQEQRGERLYRLQSGKYNQYFQQLAETSRQSIKKEETVDEELVQGAQKKINLL